MTREEREKFKEFAIQCEKILKHWNDEEREKRKKQNKKEGKKDEKKRNISKDNEN